MSAYAAMKDRGGAIGTGHILTAILNEPECVAVRLIKAQNASSADIYADMICASNTVSEKLGAPKTAKKLPSVILKYGTDLSAAAERGELDPVFGRDGETEAVIRILSRRTKNNPCLIGEPGVGKTAIAEGLAIKIAEGSVLFPAEESLYCSSPYPAPSQDRDGSGRRILGGAYFQSTGGKRVLSDYAGDGVA